MAVIRANPKKTGKNTKRYRIQKSAAAGEALDYVIINEVEGSLATGVDKTDLRGICDGLFALGVKERVTVHCPDVGVTLGKNNDWTIVPSLKLPDGWIRGSVGAGDAFCAGMLYSFLSGMSVDEGMRLASCAAACNLSVADSITGAQSLSETQELENRFERRKVCW